MTKEEIRNYLKRIGSKGGKIGGTSTSEAKKQASARNLEKARKKRWPKRKKTTRIEFLTVKRLS